MAAGRTLASAHWAIVDAGGIVTGFSGGADGLTAALVPTAAGTFKVSMTVLDNLGASATTTLAVAVGSVTDPTLPPAGTGGGGGGALGMPWLIALFASVLAVRSQVRRKLRE